MFSSTKVVQNYTYGKCHWRKWQTLEQNYHGRYLDKTSLKLRCFTGLHFFTRKKFIRKLSSNGQNLKKILRKWRSSISNIKCFYWPKIDISSSLHSNVKDGVQVRVYKLNSESVTHFSQFFFKVKANRNLRKYQSQFRKKLRKLRLRQNDAFLSKKTFMLWQGSLKVVRVHCISQLQHR